MSNAIWILRAPDGRVVGASATGPRCAIADALSQIGSSTRAEVQAQLIELRAMNPTATRYEAAGYVLALGEVAGV